MASNKDSVLVFEEPESHVFPYYTKYLGERIALEETNQFFIATHNPYLLSPIVEKGRKEDVQVFITYLQDYQTKVKPLTADEVTDLMEADPFFNLDRFVEEGNEDRGGVLSQAVPSSA
jgi:AAA15 family ATPase/GTPase